MRLFMPVDYQIISNRTDDTVPSHEDCHSYSTCPFSPIRILALTRIPGFGSHIGVYRKIYNLPAEGQYRHPKHHTQPTQPFYPTYHVLHQDCHSCLPHRRRFVGHRGTYLVRTTYLRRVDHSANEDTDTGVIPHLPPWRRASLSSQPISPTLFPSQARSQMASQLRPGPRVVA